MPHDKPDELCRKWHILVVGTICCYSYITWTMEIEMDAGGKEKE
jgi:hypothetical protein